MALSAIWKRDVTEPQKAEQAQVQAKLEAQVQEVDHEIEQQEAKVDNLSSPALDDDLDERVRRAEAHNRDLGK
jgi:hypothetical protein